MLSSDGLWDNLFTNEIVDIVNEYTNEKGVIKGESAAQGIVKVTCETLSFLRLVDSFGSYRAVSK